MFFKILFVLVVLLEFAAVPMFLKYYWPTKCKQSLLFKMISSTLFIFAGLLAMKISANNTQYATLIMWGLFFGWIGDLFLHLLSNKLVYFAIGLFAFLGGHIFYIIAFQKAIYTTYSDAGALKWYEILAVLVIVGLLILYAVKKKMDYKNPKAIAILLYALTISTMLVKACRYCIGELAYGMNEHMFMVFFTVLCGAILFVLSDGSLGILMFSGNEVKRPLRIFNIGTYYAAQLLLAASIFFVRSPAVLYGT